MKRHRSDLAKYPVVFGQGKDRAVALQSHFPPLSFTLVVFDNFDHPYKNILSGNASAHDTAVTIFQKKPGKHLWKQLKKEVRLNNVTTLTKLLCQQLIQ